MELTHAFHTDKSHSLDHPVARDQPLLLLSISYIFPPSLLALFKKIVADLQYCVSFWYTAK